MEIISSIKLMLRLLPQKIVLVLLIGGFMNHAIEMAQVASYCVYMRSFMMIGSGIPVM
jgi:hypothetical protein